MVYIRPQGGENDWNARLLASDTPSGTRCMASCDDAAVARRATREELVGTTVGVDGIRFEV